jgi:hypothetical protein
MDEVDTYELAIQMGTSPEMINKHYVHSDDYDRSTAVTRAKKSQIPGIGWIIVIKRWKAIAMMWIVLCMASARSAAMAFNPIVDTRFDVNNPRTQNRVLPSGRVDMKNYWLFLIVSSALFVFAAGMLNNLALYLSPVKGGIKVYQRGGVIMYHSG